MRAKERMDLLEKVGTELQKLYTFNEIDAFFGAVGVQTHDFEYGMSKRVYSKDVLKYVDEEVLWKVAAELDLVANGSAIKAIEPPANWNETKDFRLFISHISKDKLKATRLKEALKPYDIAGFVAHEDIHPTLAWQDEIERALLTMDAFIAVHTPGFSQSIWTQQEIGFALGRGVKVISFKMGEDPTGFIGKHQALPRGTRTADEIATEIDKLLTLDARTVERLSAAKAAGWGEPF